MAYDWVKLKSGLVILRLISQVVDISNASTNRCQRTIHATTYDRGLPPKAWWEHSLSMLRLPLCHGTWAFCSQNRPIDFFTFCLLLHSIKTSIWRRWLFLVLVLNSFRYFSVRRFNQYWCSYNCALCVSSSNPSNSDIHDSDWEVWDKGYTQKGHIYTWWLSKTKALALI